MLFLCSLALLQVQTTGLQAGESVVELAPMTSVMAEDLRHGRLVDAFTGWPISGGVVETWTEETDADMGGFFRIGEATSGLDGRFAVPSHYGAKLAEKVRVSAPGYCTLSMALGDIHNSVTLFPLPDSPTRIRVVDAHDRPIPDALFTSTYTCAHDVPAFSERTDARGWVELATYGLQDDVQELRLRAAGFGAIKYLEGDDALRPGAQEAPLTVRLRQRNAIGYTLLTKDGQPWAGASLNILDDEGHHVIQTGADGRFTVQSPYGDGPYGWYVLESPRQRYLASVPTVPGVELKIRDGANEWPDEVPTGVLEFQAKDVEPHHVWAYHSDGWLHRLTKKDNGSFEFPVGKGQLLVGGAFTGVQPLVIPFDVTLGAKTTIGAKVVMEPKVRVLGPDNEFAELWVQGAGETLDGAPFGSSIPVPADAFPVPSGVELCFIIESDHETRRICIDSATDGQVIDLRPASTIIGRAPSPNAMVNIVFSVQEAGKLHVTSPDQACTLGEFSNGRQLLTGTSGAPYLIELEAPGCLSTWFRGNLPEHSDTELPLQLEPVPYAKLKLLTQPGTQVIGFDEDDLRMLAPGPLNLVLLAKDGSRVGLHLKLQPGEERLIDMN